MTRRLDIAPSPQVASGASVAAIMRDVVIALVPATAFAVYLYGLAALLTLTAAVGTCVAFEHLACRARGVPSTMRDWSAAVTGLIYGLTLPPSLPLWMTVLGAAAGVGAGKLLFGGLGANVFNPALVGRAFLQAAFPAAMTTWHAPLAEGRWLHVPPSLLAAPLTTPQYDGLSGATPLAAMKFQAAGTDTVDLFLGLTPGSLGETSAVLLLAGGLYLAARRVVDWRIPTAILGTVALAGTAGHAVSPQSWAPPLFMLFSGGLMLGAVYMATDPVASPITAAGAWVYGILIGLLVLAIRRWGGLPEGVMYAILIANAVSPLIDRWLRPGPPRARLELGDA
jgi:electron transport complex protein RnfD